MMSAAVKLFDVHDRSCCKKGFRICCFVFTYKRWYLRVAVALGLAVVEVSVSVFAAVVYIDDALGMNALSRLQVLELFKSLNKFLLPFRVISTSLLLKIEYYALEQSKLTTYSQVINDELDIVVVEKYSAPKQSKFTTCTQQFERKNSALSPTEQVTQPDCTQSLPNYGTNRDYPIPMKPLRSDLNSVEHTVVTIVIMYPHS